MSKNAENAENEQPLFYLVVNYSGKYDPCLVDYLEKAGNYYGYTWCGVGEDGSGFPYVDFEGCSAENGQMFITYLSDRFYKDFLGATLFRQFEDDSLQEIYTI